MQEQILKFHMYSLGLVEGVGFCFTEIISYIDFSVVVIGIKLGQYILYTTSSKSL